MATRDPADFYAQKGLKRTTITLRPESIETLADTAKTFTKQIKTTTQGEVVDVMTALYRNNPQFADMVNEELKRLLEAKEVKKTGRPVSTLEGKIRNLSDEERAKIEAMLDGN